MRGLLVRLFRVYGWIVGKSYFRDHRHLWFL